jgi:hypothetical protein
VQRIAAHIAGVLTPDCDRTADDPLGPKDPPAPADVTTSVLTAYAAAGVVRLDGSRSAAGELVLLLLPAGDPDADVTEETRLQRQTPWLDLIAAFAARTQAVVVGAPADPPGATGALVTVRSSESLASKVSTVDGLDTEQGRVVAVRALAFALAGTRGSYGSQRAEDGPFPTASPSVP